ncbi:MAG: class I SAM-dependent methyltransferase [Actinomycetota bacterium]
MQSGSTEDGDADRSNSGDRLDWIFDQDASGADLAAKYDRWAETYDDDHDSWGWRGPEAIATALVGALESHGLAGPVLDAGCGTGRAGAALRSAGFGGPLSGLDLSTGMLDVAAQLGLYKELVQGTLDTMPFDDGAFDAVVSAGVLTHGHVAPSAMRELARVTRAGGYVAITQRLDLADRYAPTATALSDEGVWREHHRSAPARFHPDRDASEQFVIVWQVC